MTISQIQPQQLRDWLQDPARPQPTLLDVREPWEVQICSLAESLNIPMNHIADQLANLNPEAETVVICHHGGRSMQVALFLERSGFGKLHNLSGGVDAWARQIDPAMSVY
ncbi:MAG: rhodanese-like domain-containing protein [Burkholderiales bacterium]